MESFGEYVAPTDAIRDILRGYPFSIGLFREILQNSDDALASKQIFVLDHRQHPSKTLCHPHLQKAQGPALLAFNNGILQEKDWKALRNIHKSSKTSDNMKIGKFGLGFRSCYHVTDIPHIISGSHLAILDPQHHFREDGGVRLNIVDNVENFEDHLSAFDSILPRSQWGKFYHGSIFRFPLRSAPSQISNKTTSVTEISELLRNFAREELGISLLFLRNVSAIDIYEITSCGDRIDIAAASITRTELEEYSSHYETRKVTIRTSSAGSTENEVWRIIHAPFSDIKAGELLHKRLGSTSTHTDRTLSGDKLNATIDLAIPCNPSSSAQNGRLFTFLPLPLNTGFPVHINALFSLTQSRQNLRNADEIGIVRDSEDRVRIEWNKLLFDTYIPQAWAILLEILVKEDHIPNIFSAWPKHQGDVQSGDAMNWKDMPRHVAKHALQLAVWPIFGTNPPSYQRIASLVVEERSSDVEDIVAALVRTGVQITRLPKYLTKIIMENYMSSIKVLSPEVAYGKLKSFVHEIKTLENNDTHTILTYLLSTANCEYIVGLPLVPSVSGTRITLLSSQHGTTYHVLFNETEETLFAEYDPEAISLKRLATSASNTLISYGSSVLNVTQLKPTKVFSYLNKSVYAAQQWGPVSQDRMRWLNIFWEWAQATEFSRYANRFFLVPTTQRTQRLTDKVFDPLGELNITHILEALGIFVIDPRLEAKARCALTELRPTSEIHSLLRSIPLSSLQRVSFSEVDCNILSAYLVKHLPGAYDSGPVAELSYRLRVLPIYPIISYSEDGMLTTRRSHIPASSSVRGLYPLEIPVIPYLDDLVYLNLTLINSQVLTHLNPEHPIPLSTNDMHDLMLQHFTNQLLSVQLAFVKYLSQSSYVPRKVLARLSTTNFLLARDNTFQAPAYLIDPKSPLAELFPGPTSSLPVMSNSSSISLINLLRDFSMFLTELSPEIVLERIQFINSGNCPDPEGISRALIHLLNDAHFDLRSSFDPLFLSSHLKWIPTTHGLKGPSECRDQFSHQAKTDLFDEAMPLVDVGVHVAPHLRSFFGWNEEVSTEIVLKQLSEVVGKSLQPPFQKVFEIVKALGSHQRLTKTQLSSLRKTLHLRNWVPTRIGTVESVPFALLGEEDIPQLGFHAVAFDSNRHPEVLEFLRSMGCVERPPKETILLHLRYLHSKHTISALDEYLVQGVIQLLMWLPKLSVEDRGKLFIPDERGYLQPFGSIYFNDVGDRAILHKIDSGGLAHATITPDLASTLGLQRLGLMGFQEQSDSDLDIGGDWVTAIRTRLQDHTDNRFLLDLISLASDARATEINILLDEASGPTQSLLSRQCYNAQRSPALVIQYDGTFNELNVREMLYSLGIGRFDKKDSVGTYGFGALSMFHVTEFATVLSQGQIWFLDPCKSHLGIDKTVLHLPLSVIRKSYGDHLSPLLNLFGFVLPEDVNQDFAFNGTIIRLPLRSNSRAVDVQEIFTKTTSLQGIASDFKNLVPKCLIFTSLTAIRLHHRQSGGRKWHSLFGGASQEVRLQWSINASHKDFSQTRGDIDIHTVTINHPSSMKAPEEWRVFSLETNKHSPPPGFASLLKQYRLDCPLFVRIAVCLSSISDPTRNLFTTFPHSINLYLPIHISGPFILTPDKTTVRLENPRVPEYTYNHWLLTSVIPTVYLRLLEDRASLADNTVYWPGNSKVAPEDASTDISTLVGNAVYRMALAPTSNDAIFRSKFHPHSLSSQAACFITSLPRAALTVLETIKPFDVVQLPSSITRRLEAMRSPQFSLVTPKYMHTQLSSNSTQISMRTFDLGQIQGLIDFLARDVDALDCLSGLSLLPLEDGTFAEFGLASSTTCFYVVSPQVHQSSIFKQNRLVHHELTSTRLLDIDRLNVKPITDNNIKNLLDDQISPSETLEGADPQLQQWITSFWKVFSLLKVSTTSIASYPLIPALKTGSYLSLAYCKTSAILADFTQHADLCQSLSQMGMMLVNTATLPSELRTALPPTALTVDSVLFKILNRGPAEIQKMFNSLDSKTRPKFISWVRADWQKKKKGHFQKHPEYRTLPIWNAANNLYVSANEAQMLPKNVTVDSIGPFASKVIVGYDVTLVYMGLEPPTSITSLLQIPERLDEQHDKAYKNLLHQVLFVYIPPGNAVLVPNSQRLMQKSTTLYSSRDDLFTAAFGFNSERFIHPSFTQLEPQLEKYGLKRQRNLSVTMFRDCVEVFNNASGNDLGQRAAVLFRIWDRELPRYLNLLNQDQLNSLDDYRFISRHMTARPFGSADDDSRYIRPLPEIVSPNQLVRAEFQSIAWSQRALYKTQPHPNVVKIHPNLSTPNAQEVVAHLVVLATKVALDHDESCRLTLVNHLEETYAWLDAHAHAAKPFLQKCKEDELAIFLNTEVPQMTTMEDWTWKRAEHILLSNDSDTGYLQYPRAFIKPFRPLLEAAGAVYIDYGKEVKPSSETSASEDRYLALCSTLNKMRRNGVCTDVKFTFGNEGSLYAHRTFLAAYSDYFLSLFSNPSLADMKIAVVPLHKPYTKRAANSLLDFAYTSQAPEINQEDPEITIELLLLAHLWGMANARNVIQSTIIKLKMVDPFNLDTIKDIAEQTESQELARHCDDFAKMNAPLIRRVKEERGVVENGRV